MINWGEHLGRWHSTFEFQWHLARADLDRLSAHVDIIVQANGELVSTSCLPGGHRASNRKEFNREACRFWNGVSIFVR